MRRLIDEGYSFIVEVEGKGICGIFPFMFTIGLVTGIDEIGYKERFCYPKEYASKIVNTLVQWEHSKEPVEGDPDDPYWIKRKGHGGEWGNPNHPNYNVKFDSKEAND